MDLQEWGGEAGTGLIWLGIETGGGQLLMGDEPRGFIK